MRIISGYAKGRRLTAPTGEKTRPTSDKIRGSLFNILINHIPGSRVLDLFGGTGAMALEAMSRGADSAVIVDTDRMAIDAIRKNADAVLTENDTENVVILRSDYRKAIPMIQGAPFDVIFLDPPYAMTGAYADAVALLEKAQLIAENAVIVCERRADVPEISAEGFAVTDTRTYGDTSIDFLRRICERIGG